MTTNDTMGGERKVDVMQIMRHMVRMYEIEGGDDRYDVGHDAIAAVAELIEASMVSAALMHALIDALDDAEFSEGDGEVLDRLNAALSRIGGTP